MAMTFGQNLTLVLVGLVIGSAAYLTKNFVLQQMIEYKKTIGKIRNRLKFYSNVITSPARLQFGDKSELHDEASKILRELSCELEEYYYAIGFRKVVVFANFLPNNSDIESAAQSLIFLSNSTHVGEPSENHAEINKIKKLLRIGDLHV